MKFLRWVSTHVEKIDAAIPLLAQRRRVKKVVAEVAAAFTHTTPRNNGVVPLALFVQADDLGVGSGESDDRPFDCDRGHLVALEFGGPEASLNLVPMYGVFNQVGAWKQRERDLSSWVVGKGGTSELTIECIYPPDGPGPDPRLPLAFSMRTVVIAGANLGESKDWPRLDHVRPHPVNRPDAGYKALLVNARTEMEAAGWMVENHYEWENMPMRRRRPVFPVGARPYAVLDYIAWKEILASKGGDVALAKRAFTGRVILSENFAEYQREKVKEANRALHDGYLVSDDANDWAFTDLRFRALGHDAGVLMDVGGTDSAPQVDHIIAEARTGTSAFSNAQLLSSAYNNFKKTQLSVADALALVEHQYADRMSPAERAKMAAKLSHESAAKKQRLEKMKGKKSGPLDVKTHSDLKHKTSKGKPSKKK